MSKSGVNLRWSLTALVAALASISVPASAQDTDEFEVTQLQQGVTDAAPYPRPATPIEISRWARLIIENYPAEALRYEHQGTVGVSLNIDRSGLVARCHVTRSSGYPVLDTAACAGLKKHAKFNPALGNNGESVMGTWATNIVYAIN